ncbi:MAG: response regulator containing a CheY-like receiver domain and an HD-GYP domain [Spirochaetes bacterium]|nr:MAG: response regulator containing a CheY-like receiver domain and an HD-GYP domain [Spirochaetota bacterium]
MNGLKRNSILVIDDDPAIRKVLSLGLERLGYEVILAQNGQEGIDLLEKQKWEPDIILLDIRMPVLTGREALPRIRAMKPLTPVIMLTAYNDLATGLEMMKSGAFDYLVKPTRLEQISETIQRAVRFKDLMWDKIEQDRRNEEYKKNLEKTMESRTAELNETYQKLKAANLQTVEVLAETIEAKDHYTQGHCQRVRMISVRIAKSLQFPKEKIEALEFAALLHDIGKIGIPESILNKPGALNQDEIEIIKMHPLIGAQILSIVEFFTPAINGVRHHHERWNGTGYPDRVSGNDIDPLAQIITLADTFDAMAQSRPYRKALDLELILNEISSQRGKQFAPAVVDAFLGGKLYEGFIDTMDTAENQKR